MYIIVRKNDPIMKKTEFKTAFIPTLPVLTGYIFIGIGFGILIKSNNFSILVALAMSLFIYSGALQYVGIELLCAPFNPIQTALVTLTLSFRHIFYAISMIDKFKGSGIYKPFLIYGLTDETFSLEYATPLPDTLNHYHIWLTMSLLDYLYWLMGTLLGYLLGSWITFSTEGIDFCMTAMFIVILLSQILKEHDRTRFMGNHFSLIAGGVISFIMLLIFGPDKFIIPSMIGIVLVLTLVRPKLDKKEDSSHD